MFHRISMLFLIATLLFTLAPPRANAQLCLGEDHLYTLEVYDASNPVSNALVTFYRNVDRTFKADNKTVAGTEDAESTTNTSGKVTLGLDEATYFVTVIAAGYAELEVDVSVPEDGICGKRRVFLTPTGLANIDPQKSTATIDRTEIFADQISTAIVTIQARNTHNSIVTNAPVDLTGNFSGFRIEKPETTTDNAGKAKFYVQATVPGSGFLYPTIGEYSLSPIKLTALFGSATGTSGTASRNLSTVVLGGNPALSNGLDAISVTVTVKDATNKVLGNIATSIRSSASGVVLEPESVVTDANGVARFTIKSPSMTTGFITILAGGIALDARPAFSFLPTVSSGPGGTGTEPPGTPAPNEPYQPDENIPSGVLVKLVDDGNPNTDADTAVYYVSSDGKRHPFTHERIYFTWFQSFNNIHLATPEALAKLPLGRPVPFKAGTRLLKFESDPKVYALTATRKIRWITTEQVARDLYGTAWNKIVEEFAASDFALYETGEEIVRFNDFSPTEEAALAASLDTALLLD